MNIDFAYLLRNLHIMNYAININNLDLLNKLNYLSFFENLFQICFFLNLTLNNLMYIH